MNVLQTRALPRRRELLVGDWIGERYRLEERLDAGGMAEVFRARDERTGSACAVKVLHAELRGHGDILSLFAKEARIGEVVGANPHIVEVLDAGVDRILGAPFIVMELLSGETLEHALARGPLSREDTRTVLLQVANALDQAHRAGVVHRDLKPSNLFLTRTEQGGLHVKVMDFGIAKLLEGGAMRTATQVGTPAYTAPEQMGSTTRRLAERQGITIARGVSPATDVWALGLIAYELYTGEPPGHYWRFETLTELPLKVAFEELAPATARAGERANQLPPGFDGWFDRCLRKDAGERWRTAGEAVSALVALDGHMGYPTARSVPNSHDSPISTVLAQPAAWAAQPDVGRTNARATSAHPTTSSVTGTALEGRRPWMNWRRAMALAFVVLAGSGLAVVHLVERTPPPESICLQPAPDAADDAIGRACEEACEAASPASCWRLIERSRSTHAAEPNGSVTRDWLFRACGLEAIPEASSERRAWLETTARSGCLAEHCVARACVELADAYDGGRSGTPRDADVATALYKRSCQLDAGSDSNRRGVEGCIGLGRQRQALDQLEAAHAYFAAACDGGVARGCVARGTLLLRQSHRDADDDREARRLFESACASGDLEGCARLGRMVELGRGGWTRNEAEAVALYRRACDGGVPLGCVSLAHPIALGRGGLTRDPVRAAELRTRACEAGESLGCAALADMLVRGDGGLERDERRAFLLNREACDRGTMLGCANLGRMHLAGQAGLEPDARQARTLLARACDGGEPEGCLALATLELDRSPPDPALIDAWLQRACDAEAPDACVRLGSMLEDGSFGLSRDPVRAGSLYRRGCDEGSMRGCTHLANLTYLGEAGIERDLARSVELNDRACRGGDPVGCTRLGVLHALGHGTPRDLGRAAELHREACTTPEQENRARCSLLQKLLASPRVAGVRLNGPG